MPASHSSARARARAPAPRFGGKEDLHLHGFWQLAKEIQTTPALRAWGGATPAALEQPPLASSRAVLMRANAAQLLVLLCGVAVAGAQQDCFGTLADINSACCTPSSCAPGGSGVPDECGADCAALFVPFFQDCRSVLDAVGTVDLSAFDDFYQGCDAVDGEGACEWASGVMAELEDARRQVASLQRQAGALRSTSCCEANPHWNGRFADSAVCGFSPQQGDEDNDGHPDCIAAKNQLEAEEVCMSFGGRLCSVAELISGEASATGCGFDRVQVWSKNAGSWYEPPRDSCVCKLCRADAHARARAHHSR